MSVVLRSSVCARSLFNCEVNKNHGRASSRILFTKDHKSSSSALRLFDSPASKVTASRAPEHVEAEAENPSLAPTKVTADTAGENGRCILLNPVVQKPKEIEILNQSLANLQMNVAILNQMQHQIGDGKQDAFFVVDAAAIAQRYELWHKYLPHVRPFYAVKCNPDPFLIECLARLGTGFDCASMAEIEEVLNHDVDPNDIIFANPCKQASHIEYAKSRNVDMMTFDCIDELTKVKAVNPDAQLVLRLFVDDTKSLCRLGTKFGAMVHDVPSILEHAKKLNLNVIGTSFHVGSGCFSVLAYSEAVARARKVFDIASSMGFNFEFLDIGGGFPGTLVAPITFEDCAKELQTSLATHFPKGCGVRIISEPGRFFAASTHSLAVNVIGRKAAPQVNPPEESLAADDSKNKVPNYMYFLNDGLYGSFNCVVYDHPYIQPIIFTDDPSNVETYKGSIWGPTCDGLDCILKEVNLPLMEIGQWIVFPAMGAYTSAAASHFNGFAPPKKVYFDSRDVEGNNKAERELEFVH